MIDYQRTIDDIQSLLYSGGDLPLDAVSALSQSYTGACELANDRLRKCQELLRKGLRAEAIQRCEVEPNLLDLVNALDFPERAQWCALLQGHKLLTPPELLVEVAADINAAYAKEQPLTALMRRHRLLALARAPLRQRINTLAQIMDADPENPIWDEDLKTYERVRHDQIQSAVADAGRQNDMAALAVLEREVHDPNWREPPPAALVRRVAETATAVRKRKANDQLAALAPELAAAHAQMDYEGACQLRQRWLIAAREVALQPDDALARSAASVLDWLELEDEKDQNRNAFVMTVAELEQALDDDAPPVELDRIFSRLAQFDQEIPEALVIRYHGRLESHTLAAARRSKLILVTTVGLLLLIASVTGFFIVRQIHLQTVAGYAMALEQMLNDGNLREAEDYWTDLNAKDASLGQELRLAELKGRLDGLVRAETERQSAFEKAMAAAEATPLDQPDESALGEARRLARSDRERSRISDLERKIANKRREMNRQRNEQFQAGINELSDPLAKLEKGELLGFKSRLAAVNNLLTRVASLERDGAEVDADFRGNLNPIRAKLEAWKRSDMDKQRIEARLTMITHAVGNRQAFRDELLNYAKEFPDTNRALTFSKIADKELPLWEAISAWDELIGQWSEIDSTKLSSAEATAKIDQAKALLAKSRLSAESSAVEQRLVYLESIARRTGESGPIVADLDRALEFFFVDNVYMVRAKDGTRYYCKERPQGNKLNYLPDNNQNSKPVLKFLTPDEIETAAQSPQSVESDRAQALLIRLSDENWESTFLKIYVNMLNNEQMDPIVKIQLMDAVLGVGCKGSRCLESGFARQLMELDRASERVKDVDWVRPNNREAQAPRAEGEKLLISLREGLAEGTKKAGEEWKRLARSPFAYRFHWVGWLHRDTADRWTCVMGTRTPPSTAELCVVTQSESSENNAPIALSVSVVGALDGKSASIASEDAKLLVEGRPIYVRLPIDQAR